MTSLAELAQNHPTRELAVGTALIEQGLEGGDLFILEDGELSVERDGITIASITRSGSVVGEMSVILGTPASATVRATVPSTVRVIRDARTHLEHDQALTFRLAWLMATRLDATSAYLVQLTRQNSSRSEQSLLGKILAALHLPADDAHDRTVARNDMFGNGPDASRD
jgi:CRP/FNR family cyclic AMP-dependent transcriptional regulator